MLAAPLLQHQDHHPCTVRPGHKEPPGSQAISILATVWGMLVEAVAPESGRLLIACMMHEALVML